MRRIVALCMLCISFQMAWAQFDTGDTLRGMLNPFRSGYDVTFYDLDIKIDPATQSISGKVTMRYKAVANPNMLQVDLFENMYMDSIIHNDEQVRFDRRFDAVFISIREPLVPGEEGEIEMYYHGKPTIAKRAPWDGGFVWKEDRDGNPWVGVACEGDGASLWWPNKDHLSDEPDSMMIRVTVPKGLTNVSNGRLVSTKDVDGAWTQFNYFVSYPINNYNVTVNIAKYVHIADEMTSSNGKKLTLDYYVMPYKKEEAIKQFEQVKPMMKCFEKYLGPYPFNRDGYKLVETRYLGMEHQGAIAYGNNYKTGYAGTDYSRIGLDFDYIIIHETGHEWWGNNVSCKDIADLWIHEGFCTYSEALYVECMFDYDKAMEYVNAKKPGIGNKKKIIGTYNVNHEGDGDMYNKGMLFLNTLRHVIDNDEVWFDILLGLNKDLGLKTTTTEEVVTYISDKAGTDFTHFFNQYLNHPAIPMFEYQLEKQKGQMTLRYRWKADVVEFDMPIKVITAADKYELIKPTSEWQEKVLDIKKADDFAVAEDQFYVTVKDSSK